MKKIFLLSLVVLGILFSGQVVFASDALLSVTPITAEKSVGTIFNVNVQIDPAGNKICVVKGTLIFDNLTCQSISVDSGLMAQVTPTCASPSFTLGIANCTTSVKNLLSVSVKGATTATAGLSFAGVKVIGVGTAVPFVLQNGAYKINAVAVTKPKVERQVTVEKPVVAENVQVVTEPVAENTETLIPKEAEVAAVSTTSKNISTSPMLWIVLVAVVILAGMWGYDKFFKKNKA